MHAAGIEAVPAAALGLLAVAREIGLAVVDIGDVVLAGDVENLLVGPFDDLVGGVPLLLLRQVADIAGMDQEGRLHRQRLDLGDRLAERRGRVGVRRLFESRDACR